MNWFVRWFTIPTKYDSLEKIIKIFGYSKWRIIEASMTNLLSEGVDAGLVGAERVASLEATRVATAVASALKGVDPAFSFELETTISNLISQYVDRSLESFAIILKKEIAKLLGVGNE